MADVTIRDVLDCEPAEVNSWLAHIADNLCAADRRGLASINPAVPSVLGETFLASPFAYVAFAAGKPVAVFGVLPGDRPLAGKVWLIGTKSFARNADSMAAEAGRIFGDLLRTHYGFLGNVFDRRNPATVRFFKAAGFTRRAVIPSAPGTCVQLYARLPEPDGN